MWHPLGTPFVMYTNITSSSVENKIEEVEVGTKIRACRIHVPHYTVPDTMNPNIPLALRLHVHSGALMSSDVVYILKANLASFHFG